MTNDSVALIPMVCLRCQNPIEAQPDEVAWVCQTCGQGLLLDDEKGLAALDIHFAASIPVNDQGRPFWVTEGQASLQRTTFQGDKTSDMQAFWQNPRRFFIPAFDLPIDQVIKIGSSMLYQPPGLQAGAPAKFMPVTVPPQDVLPLAEFILLGVEADRRDALKELHFTLDISIPELWILP